LFESLPPEGSVPSCQTVGVLGAACGVVGSLMASECVKVITEMRAPLIGRFLHIDLGRPRFSTMNVSVRQDCEACGATRLLDARDPEDYRSPRCISR
jgi:adenylyltransferase/sulfurtransferase